MLEVKQIIQSKYNIGFVYQESSLVNCNQEELELINHLIFIYG